MPKESKVFKALYKIRSNSCIVFIISQIEKGIIESGMTRSEWPEIKGGTYFIDADRSTAIQKAVSLADKNDTILIAGKGHEDYQITGTVKRHFDDREEARKAVNAL